MLLNSQTFIFQSQGIEKKHAKLQGGEKAVVARHEAGHAVVGTAVAKLLPGQPCVEVGVLDVLLLNSGGSNVNSNYSTFLLLETEHITKVRWCIGLHIYPSYNRGQIFAFH